MTTLRDTLRRAARALTEAGSEEAGLEAELLLAHALDTDRAHLYQRLPEDLSPDAERAFDALLRRRLAHEPTAYIIGRREFYGLEFEVTPAAIIPRPETETLVELVLDFCRSSTSGRPFLIADVGVGCGAIAVALAVNLPEAKIIAIDISPEALALARRNAERHSVARRIRFLEGDLLAPLASAHPIAEGDSPGREPETSPSAHPVAGGDSPWREPVEGQASPETSPSAHPVARPAQPDLTGRPWRERPDEVGAVEGRPSSSRPLDVIAANLPYVRTADFEAGPPEIRQHEPRLGLDGGPDGLRLIDRLLAQAPAHLRPGGALFAEIGEDQGAAARDLARRAFPHARVDIAKDLSGLDRVLVVRTA